MSAAVCLSSRAGADRRCRCWSQIAGAGAGRRSQVELIEGHGRVLELRLDVEQVLPDALPFVVGRARDIHVLGDLHVHVLVPRLHWLAGQPEPDQSLVSVDTGQPEPDLSITPEIDLKLSSVL